MIEPAFSGGPGRLSALKLNRSGLQALPWPTWRSGFCRASSLAGRSRCEGSDDRRPRSDRFSERVRRGLQAFTHVAELTRREVNAFLLYFGAFVLGISPISRGVSPIAHRLELLRHRLDSARELGQMFCDLGYVFLGRHV